MVRVTKETRPWGDGGKQMTRKVYAANSSRFYDTWHIYKIFGSHVWTLRIGLFFSVGIW